jgi:hypothetical protein
MTKNMSKTDAIIRLIVAAVIAILYFTKVIDGTLAIVLGVVGLIFIVTGFLNFCPLYAAFGLRTRKKTA